MTVDKLITFTNVLPLLPLTISKFRLYLEYYDMSILQTKIFFYKSLWNLFLENKSHIVMSSPAAAAAAPVVVMTSNGLHKSRIL